MIEGDPTFENIRMSDPLEFTTDPSIPPHMRSPRRAFNEVECSANLAAGMKYECGLNIFWLNWFESLTNMAPIPEFKVRWLQNHFFRTIADDFPNGWRLFIALKTGENPNSMRGSLLVLSPLELIWSFVLGVKEVLPGISEDEKLLLRKAMLTIPVEFHTIDDLKTRLFKCHALREAITQAGDSVRRSATARMMDIIESKRLLDSTTTGQPLGAAACAKLWAENVKMSENENSEPIKVGFVDAVFTIEKRMLRNTHIAKLIVDADQNMPNNPFNSVYKFDTIIKKAGTEPAIRWCVAGCLDLVKSGVITSGELAVRQLSGRGLPGGKGLLDTLLGKFELGHHLANTAISIKLHSNLVSKLNRWLDGHNEYRKDTSPTQHVACSACGTLDNCTSAPG